MPIQVASFAVRTALVALRTPAGALLGRPLALEHALDGPFASPSSGNLFQAPAAALAPRSRAPSPFLTPGPVPKQAVFESHGKKRRREDSIQLRT